MFREKSHLYYIWHDISAHSLDSGSSQPDKILSLVEWTWAVLRQLASTLMGWACSAHSYNDIFNLICMFPYLTSHFAFLSRSARLSIGKGLLAKEKRQYKRTPGITLFEIFLSLLSSTMFLFTKVLLPLHSPAEMTFKPGLHVELASREWNVIMSFRPLTITTHSSVMYKEILTVQAGQSRFGEQISTQVVSEAFFNIPVAFWYCVQCLPNCTTAHSKQSDCSQMVLPYMCVCIYI